MWTSDFVDLINICENNFAKKESIFTVNEKLEQLKNETLAGLKKN